jgi:hypothetical protein
MSTSAVGGKAAAAGPSAISDKLRASLEQTFSVKNLNDTGWQNKNASSFPDGVGYDSDTASYYAATVGKNTYYCEVDDDGASVHIYDKSGKLLDVATFNTDNQGNIDPNAVMWLNPAQVDKTDNQVLSGVKLKWLDNYATQDTSSWKGDAADTAKNFTAPGSQPAQFYSLKTSSLGFPVDIARTQDAKSVTDWVFIYNHNNGMLVDAYDANAQVKYDPTTTGPNKEPSATQPLARDKAKSKQATELLAGSAQAHPKQHQHLQHTDKNGKTVAHLGHAAKHVDSGKY